MILFKCEILLDLFGLNFQRHKDLCEVWFSAQDMIV